MIDLSLEGKTAIVCGASQGIGKSIAKEVADLGARCILLARREDRLKGVVNSLSTEAGQKHRFLAADYSHPEDLKIKVETLLSQTGPVHILINNTGGPKAGPVLEAKGEDFREAFEQHLVCNQILVQAVVEGMKAEGFGRILNIISTSVREPIPGLGVSNTIRGAVASWAKSLSKELGPHQITVNNLLPGFTDTDRLGTLFQGKANKEGRSLEDIRAEAISKVPIGRIADPKEVAQVAAFLVSPAASYISGQSLAVDGGRLQSI